MRLHALLFDFQFATELGHLLFLCSYLRLKVVINLDFLLLERLELILKLVQIRHRKANRFEVLVAVEPAPLLNSWLLYSNLNLILQFYQLLLSKHTFQVHLVCPRIVLPCLELQSFIVDLGPAHFLDKIDKLLFGVSAIAKVLQGTLLHFSNLLYFGGS